MGNTSTGRAIFDYNGDNLDHSDLDFIGRGEISAEAGERDPLTSVADISH